MSVPYPDALWGWEAPPGGWTMTIGDLCRLMIGINLNRVISQVARDAILLTPTSDDLGVLELVAPYGSGVFLFDDSTNGQAGRPSAVADPQPDPEQRFEGNVWALVSGHAPGRKLNATGCVSPETKWSRQPVNIAFGAQDLHDAHSARRTTTSLSPPDSAPHTSPARPRIWRTAAPGVGNAKTVKVSVSGSKRTRALLPKSLSQT